MYVSQAPAEYGWTAGGVVTFATKSGTNLWSGEVFEFFRDKSLNTMNKFEKDGTTPAAPRSRTSAGTSSAGRSAARSCRIELHFFAAAERTKTNQFTTVTTGRPEFYSSLEGTFPIPEYSNMLFARGDVQISQQQTAFVRYAWQDSDFTCDGCGGQQRVLLR